MKWDIISHKSKGFGRLTVLSGDGIVQIRTTYPQQINVELCSIVCRNNKNRFVLHVDSYLTSLQLAKE